MDPKKILEVLQIEDLSTLSYNELENRDLYKIMDNFNAANTKIINILKNRDQKEEREFVSLGGEEDFPEEEEERTVATILRPASMADIAPMSTFRDSRLGKQNYVMHITVGKDHQGNANVTPEFMRTFNRLRKTNNVDSIVGATKVNGIDGVVFVFDLDGGRTKHTTTHDNPEYYLSLNFFFDWIESRKESARVNLNSHLRVVDEEGNDVSESEPKRINIKGHFRSPRLEQYLVADFKVNKYEFVMETEERRSKARLTSERETFWEDQIGWFDKLKIKYPQPKYFKAEEALRKMIKEVTEKVIKGTGVLQF